MSGGWSCKCSERQEPLRADPGSNRPPRAWRVYQRYCNHSAFNGYRETYSEYSSVRCLRCGASWRTKADFVSFLPDMSEEEINILPGTSLYLPWCEANGREPHR